MKNVDKMCGEIQKCVICSKYDYLTVNVYNEKYGYGKYGCHLGSAKARVMVIGQNPSHIRFPPPLNHSMSGKQGDLFREIFGEHDLIFTNLVPYSTSSNNITKEDALHGLTHLLKQIQFYKPKLIIALGKWVRETLEPISEMHLKYKLKDRIVYLKHPDYFLSYHPEGLTEYRKQIEAAYNSYLQTVNKSIR
jgi:uracil-DNA glycosylase